jgi:hypothetical protein
LTHQVSAIVTHYGVKEPVFILGNENRFGYLIDFWGEILSWVTYKKVVLTFGLRMAVSLIVGREQYSPKKRGLLFKFDFKMRIESIDQGVFHAR